MRSGSRSEAFRTVAALGGVAVGAALLLSPGPAAAAPAFSIDLASPSAPAVSNSSLLGPGPGPPAVLGAPGSMGLVGGATDEMNAMTTQGAIGTLHFSVTHATRGIAGAVVPQAALGQAAGDLFSSRLDGRNHLVFNQDVLGLLPAVGPGATTLPPRDDVDALDFKAVAPPVAFALAAGHALLGTSIGCGGDIFFDGNPGGLFFGYPTLGLASCSDDIDALHAGDDNAFYFSLAPGSPSLAPGSAIAGCTSAGCSAADVFVSTLDGTASRFATADALGLRVDDDVDALAWTPTVARALPALDPVGATVLGALLLAVGASRLAVRTNRSAQACNAAHPV